MERACVENLLAAAIDAESRVRPIWRPGAEMAPIAFRRWCSFARRHPKTKHPKPEDRTLDLAKGLQAYFEPDTPYTHLNEWLHLAGILARVLTQSPQSAG